MPIIGDRVEIERKPKLGGGGPGKIPHRHGYGGGDDGDHGNSGDFQSREQRMRRYRMGKGRYDEDTHRWVRDWIPLTLPYFQLWTNSLVLLLSSLTLELARRSMDKKEEFAAMGIVPPRMKRDLPWLGITLLLGFGFLAGQIVVWNSLRHQGVYLVTNPSRSYFYLLTGAHAVHLAGGLLALLVAAGGRLFALKFESQKIAVEVTSWYWHYLAFLWFGIFALVHFAKG